MPVTASSSGISAGERRNVSSSNRDAGRYVARNTTVPLDGDNVSSSGASLAEELLALCKTAERSKIYR